MTKTVIVPTVTGECVNFMILLEKKTNFQYKLDEMQGILLKRHLHWPDGK